jgi:hypothetical protein
MKDSKSGDERTGDHENMHTQCWVISLPDERGIMTDHDGVSFLSFSVPFHCSMLYVRVRPCHVRTCTQLMLIVAEVVSLTRIEDK